MSKTVALLKTICLLVFSMGLWVTSFSVNAESTSIKIFGPTQPCDDLKELMQHMTLPAGTTQAQFLMAVMQTNQPAFYRENIQGLKIGYFLKMPSAQNMQSLSPQKASTMLETHHQRWADIMPTIEKTSDRLLLAAYQKKCPAQPLYDKRFLHKSPVDFLELSTFSAQYQEMFSELVFSVSGLVSEHQKLIDENQQLTVKNQQLEREDDEEDLHLMQTQALYLQANQQILALQHTIQEIKQSIPSHLTFSYLFNRLSVDVQTRLQQAEAYNWNESERVWLFFFCLVVIFTLFLIPLIDLMMHYQRENASRKDNLPMAEPLVDIKDVKETKDVKDVKSTKGGINFSYFAGEDIVTSKLDLARAYIDMGDFTGAKELLQTILKEGNEDQKREAKGLLERVTR